MRSNALGFAEIIEEFLKQRSERTWIDVGIEEYFNAEGIGSGLGLAAIVGLYQLFDKKQNHSAARKIPEQQAQNPERACRPKRDPRRITRRDVSDFMC